MRLLLLETILRSGFPFMEIIDYKYFMVIMKISLANNLTNTQLGMTIVPMTYTCILDLIYSLSLWTLSNFQADMIFIITHALMSCKKFIFTHLHSLLWWIFLCVNRSSSSSNCLSFYPITSRSYRRKPDSLWVRFVVT